ncbi:MAG TPA: ATP-binding protein [Phenylobacterium sp.]
MQISGPSLNGSVTPMARLDGAGVVVWANLAMTRLLGEVPREGALFLDGLKRAACDQTTDDFGETYAFGGADGERRWFRLNLEPEVEGHLAILTDITAICASLDIVRPARAARDELLALAGIGTWRFDPDADLYFFSPEVKAPYESDSRAVPRVLLDSGVHPDDLAKERPLRERVTREGGEAEIELRMRTPDGEWNHLRVMMRSGRQLPSGRYEMYGLTQHVTDLARARDAASTAAHRLALALEGSRAGVFEYDYVTASFWLSPELERLVGREAIQRTAGDAYGLFHAEDRSALLQLALQARDASPGHLDVRLLRDGGETWVRLYLEAERAAEGPPLRAVGLVIDVDEAKRYQLAATEARRHAEAATEAKSNFLASVSHEIRTPMNGVVGVLNLLKREPISEEGRLLLGEALGCAAMLGQLLNDVLDFSKIEAGKLEIVPVPTEPASIAESVASLLRPQAEAKGLSLTVQVAPDVGWAALDPVRLRQCLFNTMGNAIKFTDHGGVDVRLTMSGVGEARRLRCEIQDTGIGVPESARDVLFGRFHQVDQGSARRFGGTGLGLAISRHLARLMGGDLDFVSQEGVGSTFWFELAAPPAAATVAPEQTTWAEAPLAGLVVLVVDDNRVNRLVAVKSLEAMGASASAVKGGAEAVEAVAQGHWDLVLMDVNMPGMDGLEATRRIRALGPTGAMLPIIALTADGQDHQRQACLSAGMNGVAVKPFAPEQLLREIMAVADRDEPERMAG